MTGAEVKEFIQTINIIFCSNAIFVSAGKYRTYRATIKLSKTMSQFYNFIIAQCKICKYITTNELTFTIEPVGNYNIEH